VVSFASLKHSSACWRHSFGVGMMTVQRRRR